MMCNIEEAFDTQLDHDYLAAGLGASFWDSKQVWILEFKKILPWPTLILRLALDPESSLSMML